MKLNVPVNGFTSFQIHRAAFDEDVTIVLPNGETYLADAEELRQWLIKVGVDGSIIDKVVDLVWNFRRVQYNLPEQRVVAL